jgi:hypothetical protein
MDAVPGHKGSQTLGERLSSLGPGDPCPCCGARLEAAASPGAVRRDAVPGGSALGAVHPFATAGGVGRTGADMLACPECGCEIDAEAEPFKAGACRALSPAA